MKTYEIYQTNYERDADDMYNSLDYGLGDEGWNVSENTHFYKFKGCVDAEDLNSAYSQGNIGRRPYGMKSLSVGDIIADGNDFFIISDIGFDKLSQEIADKIKENNVPEWVYQPDLT